MHERNHPPYRGGQLHQRCVKCDWWQSGHSVVVPLCPLCGEAMGDRLALEFGGFIVEFDGTRFLFHDTDGRFVVLDEADYPEAIPFIALQAKVPLLTREDAAVRPSPWPIRSGTGDYKANNPRMSGTKLYGRGL